MKNNITFRLEEKKDYRAVENLIRESFWNVYRPGCSEHYVIHVLRDDPAFVKELDYSLEKATELGFGAVLFEGNIDFYSKCGFDYASKLGIRWHDLPEGADSSFFLGRELIHGYLKGITGVYQTPEGCYVADEDVEKFDQLFPPKKKLKLPGQIF